MFIATVIAALAIQYGAYRLWRSYRNAAQRTADERLARVVSTAHAIEYTGPTYGRRER